METREQKSKIEHCKCKPIEDKYKSAIKCVIRNKKNVVKSAEDVNFKIIELIRQ